MKVLLFGGLLLVAFGAARAQPAPEMAGGVEMATRTSYAASLRIDPAGRLYIADPGRHVVDIRSSIGESLYVLGGPGTGSEQFDTPTDVDPTNGLVLVVADTGNNRLMRFSSDYQLLETTPLYGSSREDLSRRAAALHEGVVGDATLPGRPIAVVVSESNDTFAIDETRGVVARWDMSRRLAGFIGDDPEFGRLLHPVDMEIIEDQLLVADEGAGSVVVFDLFGGYVTEYGGGRLSDVRGIGERAGELWVLHGRDLSIFTPNGMLHGVFELPKTISEPVDVALTARFVYVLCRTTLWRWDLTPAGRPPTTD